MIWCVEHQAAGNGGLATVANYAESPAVKGNEDVIPGGSARKRHQQLLDCSTAPQLFSASRRAALK
jgi:hypothetical protein